MKDTIFVLCIICILLFSNSGKLSAEVHLPLGSHEKLYKVMELPLKESYTTREGLHVDLGIKYTMFEILGIPLYQQGEISFIGYLDKNNYLLFSKELVSIIAEINNIEDIYILQKIPFWDKWGGKLLLLLLLFISITSTFHLYNKNNRHIAGSNFGKTSV